MAAFCWRAFSASVSRDTSTPPPAGPWACADSATLRPKRTIAALTVLASRHGHPCLLSKQQYESTVWLMYGLKQPFGCYLFEKMVPDVHSAWVKSAHSTQA